MIEFDESIQNLIKDLKGVYKRYYDDILIVCDVNNYLLIKEILQNEILKYELKINEEKTDIIFFQKDGNDKLRAYDSNFEF